MNDTLFKKSLTHTPEAAVKVGAGLHQDIMRAVRLAGSAVEETWVERAVPALGAAAIAVFVAAVFFYLPATTRVTHSPAPVAAQSPVLHPTGSPSVFADDLRGLLKAAPPPEEALRKELEHLKADLGKFDFRS